VKRYRDKIDRSIIAFLLTITCIYNFRSDDSLKYLTSRYEFVVGDAAIRQTQNLYLVENTANA
jgi:hypothetical protein